MKKITTTSIKSTLAGSWVDKQELKMLALLAKNSSMGWTAKELADEFYKGKVSFTEQILATLEREGKVESSRDKSLGQDVYLIA